MKRIERIEQALRRDPLVRACAVVRIPGSSVVAFLSTVHTSAQRLHEQLQASMPRDLLPRAYVGLTQLPVQSDNEVDVARLVEISACDPQVVWIEQAVDACAEPRPPSIQQTPLRRLRSPALHDAVFQAEIAVSRLPHQADRNCAGAFFDGESYLLGAAIEVASTVMPARGCVLEDVTFETALRLRPGQRRVMQVVLSLTGMGEIFKIVSLDSECCDEDRAWNTHIVGTILGRSSEFEVASKLDPEERQRSMQQRRCLAVDSYYESLRQSGIRRESTIRGIDGMWYDEGAALCRLRLPTTSDCSRMPALIESIIQSVQALVEPQNQRILVPQGIERMRFFEEPRTEECWCRLTVRTIDDTLVADVDIHEPDGCLLVSFEGLYFKLVSRNSWHDLAAVGKATSASDGSSVCEQDGFSQRFSQAAPAIRRLLVRRLVDDLTRELLGRAANETLDPNMGFFDAGMNSLGAVMLCNRLQEALHRPLPITLAFSYSTPGQLAEYLCDDVLGVQAAAHEQPSLDTVACELTARIEDSSEEQLAVRLAHQLKQLHGGAANDS